jgi:hypothetical protein
MSYGFPEQQSRKKPGGGGLIFLLIIGFVGFMIFSRMSGGGSATPQSGSGGIGVEDIGQHADHGHNDHDHGHDDHSQNVAGSKMPTTGGSGAASGWNMDDVATKKDDNGFQPINNSKKSGSKTTNGDWAMEEVEGKKKDDETGFKFSDPGAGSKAESGGDWKMEEVDGKKKDGATNSKTTNGDWALEEVGSGEGKKK